MEIANAWRGKISKFPSSLKTQRIAYTNPVQKPGYTYVIKEGFPVKLIREIVKCVSPKLPPPQADIQIYTICKNIRDIVTLDLFRRQFSGFLKIRK